MSRYKIHPLDQSFYEWDRKRVERRNNYWSMLRRAKSDWLALTDQVALEKETNDAAFYYHMQRKYGIKIELIDGKIAGEYSVIDDKKHTMFLLQYSS